MRFATNSSCASIRGKRREYHKSMISYLCTHLYVLTGVFDLLTILCMAASFFTRKKSSFFALQVLGNVGNVFSLLLNASYASSVGCVIATVRMAVFYAYGRKNKPVPAILVALILSLTLAVGVLLSARPFDLVFTAGLILFTLICLIPDAEIMKLSLVLPFTLYAVYGFSVGAAGLALSSLVEATASVLAFCLSRSKGKKRAKVA